MFHVEQHHQSNHFLENFLPGAQKLGFSFSGEVVKKFCLYYEELCRWDGAINLTGLASGKDRAVLLFVDSLAGSLALPDAKDGSMVDIGSGGGFPGIPLKLARPGLQVWLMEPKANKIAFLHTVIGKLELTRTAVIPRRLEHFHAMASDEEKCDVALCKGVNVQHILPFVDNILKKNGKLVVFRSRNIDNHHQSHHFKHMEVCDELSYELPFGYGTRVLSVLRRQA
jgi:16S rRNA (guanine527-N7)-methyltransferase